MKVIQDPPILTVFVVSHKNGQYSKIFKLNLYVIFETSVLPV